MNHYWLLLCSQNLLEANLSLDYSFKSTNFKNGAQGYQANTLLITAHNEVQTQYWLVNLDHSCLQFDLDGLCSWALVSFFQFVRS